MIKCWLSFIKALLKDDDKNPPLPLKLPKRVIFPSKLELEKLSDSELILKAIDSGIAEKIEFGGNQALDPTVPSYEKELANREELIEALVEPKQEKANRETKLSRK